VTPDYRRFLAAATTTTEVLPYLGGPYVDAADRRLRLSGPAPEAVGFWRFEIQGRNARPVERAEPPDLSQLPVVRGYAVPGYLVTAGAIPQLWSIGPEAEPLPFAPLVGRRWPGGALLFEMEDLQADVEDQVRRAFQERRPVARLPGVPAALRAAYSYAVLLRTARELSVPAVPMEASGALMEIAAEGEPAARRLLGAIQIRRAAEPGRRRAGHATPLRPGRGRGRAGRSTVEDRAAAALYAVGAVLHSLRWLGADELEVRYAYRGERFVTIVVAQTLQVLDAGICLANHDSEVTLESLPGVIDQAIRTHRLVITGV
jgi:hypothetical protein